MAVFSYGRAKSGALSADRGVWTCRKEVIGVSVFAELEDLPFEKVDDQNTELTLMLCNSYY